MVVGLEDEVTWTADDIIRKTWKGMDRTKMEGETEWHLPKTGDWRRRVRR